MAIKKSTQGYKRNSPDKGAKNLRIPNNHITMQDVDFPVLGRDNLGNQQIMYPGNDYVYPGSYVDETPIEVPMPTGMKAKSGKWIQKAVNPEHKGYCTPMTKSTCTPRRKAFAMTMKKHHGFHKKEDGGEIAQAGTNLWDTNKAGYVDSVLNANKNLNFVQRYLHPKDYPVIDRGNGEYSTHMMASSDNFAYPTIIQDKNGKLRELPPQEAYQYAMKNKQYIDFKDPNRADWFANSTDNTSGYKMGKQYKEGGPIPNWLVSNEADGAGSMSLAQNGVEFPPKPFTPSSTMPEFNAPGMPSYTEHREYEQNQKYPWRLSSDQQADIAGQTIGWDKPAQKPPEKKAHNWLTPTLWAIDALVPGQKIHKPVVYPGMSYNEHAYGTDSQAIAKHGTELPCLDCGGSMQNGGRIVNNQWVEMEKGGEVPYNNPRYKQENPHYQAGGILPGSMGNVYARFAGAVEKKVKNMEMGGDMPYNEFLVHTEGNDKERIAKYQQGGGMAPGNKPSLNIHPISNQTMQDWNTFHKYMEDNKLISESLDHEKTSKWDTNLADYKRTVNPESKLSRADIPSLQQAFLDIDVKNREFARRNNQSNAEILGTNDSPGDGWPGKKTNSSYFPGVSLIDKVDGNIRSVQDQGLMRPDWRTTKGDTKPSQQMTPDMIMKKYPNAFQDGGSKQWYYEDDRGETRLVKMRDGGSLPTAYEQGKEYDISEEEIKKLIAAGYELKMK